MGVPEIKLGLLPGAGGTQRLARLLPAAVAKQMIYFGDPLDAQAALAHGLINAVVPVGEALNEARAWATRLASLPPLALRAAKLLVHGAALGGLSNGIEAERQSVSYLFQTRDAHEGVYVATGEFTDTARSFAAEKSIRLVFGAELARLVRR